MDLVSERPQFILEHPSREALVVDAFLEQLSLPLPGVIASWYGSELVLELATARYDTYDNIMSSRPIFVERGGQESLSFFPGLVSICEDL